MTQLRDFENNHHEKVTELAVTILEKMAKNQLEEELHDDLRMVSIYTTLPLHVYSHNYCPFPSLPLLITSSSSTKTRL